MSSALTAPTPQRGTGFALATPDETSTEEPPDMSGLQISRTSLEALSKLAPIAVEPTNTPPSTSYVTPALASSLDSTFRRAYTDRRSSPAIPQSPSVADSVGGSASDYDNEHEPDSPSSLSSWNSWAGGRRGDLADVEDLELDGITAIEPELETVSELDEESSVYMSGSDRPVADSDDDAHLSSSRGSHQNGHHHPSEHSSRRKLHSSGHHTAPHPHHPHYVHHASHLHPHGTPIHPHFSPRAGGHGLSHASRNFLRTPANLAARRRKGRLAELAEEGLAGQISTTKMPSSSPSPEATTPDEASPVPDSPTSGMQNVPVLHDFANATAGDNGASSVELEILGPPSLPVRSVSPSETIPVFPSPLCVCLTADEQGDVTEVRQDVTPTREKADMMMKSIDDEVSIDEMRNRLDGNSTPTPPSPTTSGRSIDTFAASVSTPPTSPPSSPQISRKGSLRGRRASSPSRSKPKLPLRPCFKRRSTEKAAAETAAKGSRDSSSEREKGSSRGRTKVRFSQMPPVEVRTHSPVEYDRKACAVSNRLSAEDLEELRTMKMEMGLLEAKCAALAACKPERRPQFTNSFGGPDIVASSESDGEGARRASLAEMRRRADSISSSSPTSYCGSRFAKNADDKQQRMSPAEYLRMEREKERERVCRMAGIGTGVGFRYSGGPNTRQMPHGGCEALGASSIISRFGLSKPPPPLPGMSASSSSFHHLPSSADQSSMLSYGGTDGDHGYSGGTQLYRPNSAPPVRGPTSSSSFSHMPNDGRQYGRENDEDSEADEVPRGRQMEKGAGRALNHDSTSTDATVTEAEVNAMRSDVPALTTTCPSPTSRSSRSPESNYSSSPTTSRYDSPHQYSPSSKPVRPNIRPLSSSHSSPSYELMPTSSSCGYDSPASEFCYESGSEYDLLG